MVGAVVVGGVVVGATVVGGDVGGESRSWAAPWAAAGSRMVGGGAVVVTGGCVVVVVAGAVVDVDEVSGANVDGGCVGTATLSLESPSSRSARNAMPPMIQSASTAPATMRAAVTYCVPVRSPRDRRMRSAARAASTNATIVPMTGMTMLTTAHTSAAMANGSTCASPQPPAPPEPPGARGFGLGPDRHGGGVVGIPGVGIFGRLRGGHPGNTTDTSVTNWCPSVGCAHADCDPAHHR